MLEGQTRHQRLRELEHECDDITHEIYSLINHTFVTPFEREDIYELASSLDDVVDLAEEVSDKIDLYQVKEITTSARRMAEVLARAGKEVEQDRSEEHTSELQSPDHLVCRLLLE